jgi:hypothetical protein
MNEAQMNEYNALMTAIMLEDAAKEQANDALLQQDLKDAYAQDEQDLRDEMMANICFRD